MSHLIAKRYAKALFDLSFDRQNTAVLREDMIRLLATIDTSEDLGQFFDNPIVPVAKRQSILRDIFEGRVDPLMYKFILFLDQKRRLQLLRHVAHAFEGLFLEAHNIVKVKITTGIRLTQQQREAVSRALRTGLIPDVVPDHTVINIVFVDFFSGICY